jgi:hypothetical protein
MCEGQVGEKKKKKVTVVELGSENMLACSSVITQSMGRDTSLVVNARGMRSEINGRG